MAETKVVYAGPLVTRDEALALGLPRYFTGAPCRNDHTAQRRAVNGGCLECHRESGKRLTGTERRVATLQKWHEAHGERIRAGKLAYKANNKEKVRAGNALYRAANKDRISEYNRLAYQGDPDKFLFRCSSFRERHPSYHRAWRKANGPKETSYRQRRRARKRNAGGSFTGAQIERMLDAQRWRCIYCRKSLKAEFHADHKVPLARGGSNDITNIQMCCPRCNERKRTRDHIEFARVMGFLI